MKITMTNGIVLENVTAEEALQILGNSQKKQKTETAVVERVKRHYTKRKSSASVKNKVKVWRLEEEIHYILAHPEMKPLELSKTITRHTPLAISIMSSGLRSGKTTSIGKYIPKMISSFYNKNTSSIKIPVFAK
jgi:hypothetical protein